MANKILPAGVFDTDLFVTPMIGGLGWVLDKPIDARKVQLAWDKLIATWPILVGRLRQDSHTKQWQFHIPSEPSIAGSFASLHISGFLSSHYAYPSPSDSISITPQEPNPRQFFYPHAARSVEELLTSDRPMCYLHVTTFDDGTLVGIMVPHILSDAHGIMSIMKALCMILNNGETPLPLDYADPFLDFVPKPHEHVPAPTPSWHVLSTLGGIALLARSIWSSWFPVQYDWREVYFPRSEVKRLKDEAMTDIRNRYGEKTERFVSSSDAVLAFLIKCTHASVQSSAPFNFLYTASMRTAISNPRPPYLRNTTCLVITPTRPLSTIANSTLGDVAMLIRDTLKSQASEEAYKPYLRWHLAHQGKPKIFFNPYRGKISMATNIRELKLTSLDFNGALSDHDLAKGAQVKCILSPRVEGVQPGGTRDTMGLMADDESGGMWTYAHLPRAAWEDKNGFGRFTVPK